MIFTAEVCDLRREYLVYNYIILLQEERNLRSVLESPVDDSLVSLISRITYGAAPRIPVSKRDSTVMPTMMVAAF